MSAFTPLTAECMPDVPKHEHEVTHLNNTGIYVGIIHSEAKKKAWCAATDVPDSLVAETNSLAWHVLPRQHSRTSAVLRQYIQDSIVLWTTNQSDKASSNGSDDGRRLTSGGKIPLNSSLVTWEARKVDRPNSIAHCRHKLPDLIGSVAWSQAGSSESDHWLQNWLQGIFILMKTWQLEAWD